tara:strand:- start:13 stop:300 length:288 start_codon:yes stop_codon:yes gene_type:complete
MGYAGPKAISKVNMILKDKTSKHGLLGNPLKKKKVKPSKGGANHMIEMRKKNVQPQEPQSTPSVSEYVTNRKEAATKKTYNSSGMYKKGCKYGKK